MNYRNVIWIAFGFVMLLVITPIVRGTPRPRSMSATPLPITTPSLLAAQTDRAHYLDQLGRLQRLSLRPTLYIKCGGPGFVDEAGLVWQSDVGLSRAATYGDTSGHGFTLVSKLYSSGRNSRDGPIEYHLPLPLGSYTVTFYLMELYQRQPGKSIFDIEMEGGAALKDVDIVRQAGSGKPLELTKDVELYDGVLDIVVQPWRGTASLSALAIAPAYP